MKRIVLAVALLSSVACVRARTPDGKQWTCLRHTRPVRDHQQVPALPSTLYTADGTQYDCFGPHDRPVPEKINGQKEVVELVARR